MATGNRNQGILNGLKAAFIFFICFMVFRYDILLSLLFAAIGGLSVGLIVTWWTNKEPPHPRRNPLKKLQNVDFSRKYPGLDDLAARAAKSTTFKHPASKPPPATQQKSPEKTPEDSSPSPKRKN